MNWRELEAEIIDIARKHGLEVDEASNGDKGLVFTDDGVIDINVTEFAKALADRLNAKAIKVKA